MNVTPGLGLNTSRTVQGASFNLHRLHTVVILTMHGLGFMHETSYRIMHVICIKKFRWKKRKILFASIVMITYEAHQQNDIFLTSPYLTR